MGESERDGQSSARDTTARQHHCTPAMYLAGFTEDLTPDGRLVCWDMESKRQFQLSARKAARERDFYRIEGDTENPNRMEDGLEMVETAAAPILKRLIATDTLPGREDLEVLLLFVALLEARTPGFRAQMEQITEQVGRVVVERTLADDAIWSKIAHQAIADGMAPEHVPTKELIRDKLASGAIKITSPQNLKLSWMQPAIEATYPPLLARHWSLLVSDGLPSRQFVTSDRPVTLAWSAPMLSQFGPPGFGVTATDVLVPLSYKQALLGRFEESALPDVDEELVAMVNSRVYARVHRFCYSRSPDFRLLVKGSRTESAVAFLASLVGTIDGQPPVR